MDDNADKMERAINRGEEARALLENPLLTEAFNRLDSEYIAAWRVSAVRDMAAREKLWQAVNIVALVRAHLFKIMNDGKLAKADLEMRAKLRRIA